MLTTAEPKDRLTPSDPTILLAGMIAAKKSGDLFLAEIYRRELEEKHGVKVRFARPEKAVRQ